MSKRNRGARPTPPRQTTQPPPRTGPPPPGATAGEIEALHIRSVEVALTDEIADVAPTPAPGVSVDPAKLAKQAAEAEARFVAAKKKYEQQIEQLSGREQAVREGEAAQRKATEEFERKKAEVDAEAQEVENSRLSLEEREDALKAKELDAQAGFAALLARERRQSLEKLEAEIDAGRAELERYQSQLRDERSATEKQLATELSEQEERLAGLRKLIRELEVKAKVEQEMLDEDEDREDRASRHRESRRLEEAEGQVRDLTERLEAARADVDRVYAQLRERDEAMRALGHLSPKEVKQQLDRLTRERDDLKDKLAASVGPEERSRLEETARALEVSEGARVDLAHENADLRARMSRYAIAVTELETLRDQNAALESSRDLLASAVKELKAVVDERIRRTDGTSPFQQCTAMDSDPQRQDPPRLSRDAVALDEFADDLRQRIAHDPITGKTLFYTERDIRSFLGGMAMSRLHLLQGISGTGKTSLPRAAARAFGAGWRLVAVQAGWRDKHDLLGHFNEFERRYYESPFLTAMYEAQCPAFRERPYIVILDEMNLSHPEQYFADMLSALELDPQDRTIELTDVQPESSPRLIQDGRILRVPPNVWFMGTANHDETTMGFADKTFDRAHVMELPRHKEEFPLEAKTDREPIPVKALLGAFEKAQQVHEKEGVRAYAFLVDEFNDVLGDRFGIGWGNRLERQMSAYVPVVIASGGSIGEAVDHITATKLLRRIRDRHDNRIDDLDALRDRVTSSWGRLKDGSSPSRSLEIIEREQHRLRTDDRR